MTRKEDREIEGKKAGRRERRRKMRSIKDRVERRT